MIQIICAECGNSAEKEKIDKRCKNTFCSQSCAAKFNNKIPKRKKKIKNCLFCGKELPSKNKHYCNIDCQNNYKFSEWLKGKYHKVDRRTLKRFVIQRDGYKCSECNITEWRNKPIVLELEHKDGNSDNNTPSNLCLICPNCHSQTPTYKSRNKGHGRHFRRERYKQGKSF